MDQGNAAVSLDRSGAPVDKNMMEGDISSENRLSHVQDADEPVNQTQYDTTSNQRDSDISHNENGVSGHIDSQKAIQIPEASNLAEGADLSARSPDHRQDTHIKPFDLIRGLLNGDNGNFNKCRRQIADICHVHVDAIEDAYPCTPLQEGFFALSQMADGARTYTQQFILQPDSSIQITHFMMAWREVLQRCTLLRTRIVQLEGVGLIQVVIQEEMQWKIVPDLEQYLEQDKAQAMEVGQPLARNGLIMSDTTGWTFVLTMNHAVYDGASVKMIQTLLDQCLNSRELVPRGSFNHFVRHASEQSKSDAAKMYWGPALSDYASSPFPSSFSTSMALGPRQMAVMEKVCATPQAGEIGLGTLIRGAWALLVHSNTGDNDVCFGMTFSGRNAPFAGDAMGPTITTVPLRIRVSPSDTGCRFPGQDPNPKD